jgi:CRP-like cAMP-binding protein
VRLGLIKLEKRGIEGATRIVRLARPGDVIGLEIILDEAYRHSAFAMTHFDACRVPVDLVTHEIHRINGLDRKLFRQWQASVDAAHVFLTELSTGTIRTRVARLLLYLLEPAGGRDVCPAISREEIGELLGVTTESASRAMAELKREGLLDEHGPACRCDIAALRGVAAER